MTEGTFEDVEVEQCEQCQGIWFDRDELRQVKDQIDPDLNWMDFELWKHKDRFHIHSKTPLCPRCNQEMIAIEYDKTKIEVDYCDKCQGVWLDGNELQKIIEALQYELTSKSATDYLKASLVEAKEIITGPEKFLSEWRDFLTCLRFLELRIFAENPKLYESIRDIQRPFQ